MDKQVKKPFECGILEPQGTVAHILQPGNNTLRTGSQYRHGAKSLRQFLLEGEELYRLEGVHFVLVGPIKHNDAKQRAAEIRRRLSRASVSVESSQMPLVASIAVVSVEHLIGKSPAECATSVLDAVLETLYRAKRKGGNLVEVCNVTRF